MFDSRRTDVGAQRLKLAAAGCLNKLVNDAVICNQPFAPALSEVHGVDFVAVGSLSTIQ